MLLTWNLCVNFSAFKFGRPCHCGNAGNFGLDSHYGVMANAVGHRNKVLIGNIKAAQPEGSKAQLDEFYGIKQSVCLSIWVLWVK